MSYGSETDAQSLFTTLTADDTITVSPVDLSSFHMPGTDWLQAVTKLVNEDITTQDIKGTGTFDVLMGGLSAQLKQEYAQNRITGAEYTKAFIAMVQGAMQFSVQFLLGRDQAFWAAVQAQTQAVQAQVALETAKLQYAAVELEVLTGKANYALSKIKLANEDINFGVAKYNLEQILPAQLATTNYNLTNLLPQQYLAAKYNVDYMLPQQLAVAVQQVAQSVKQTLQIQEQIILTQKQEALTAEQTETARAQTMNTRTDGATTIAGVLGKQKDLYAQQITSYQRDAEVKAAKIFSDAWITMLTINESTPVPSSFANSNLDAILSSVKTNNAL